MTLAQKLRLCGAVKKGNIEFVGGHTEGFAGLTKNKTIPINSLSGGIGTQPQTGDIVIVINGIGQYQYTGSANLPTGYMGIRTDTATNTVSTKARISYKIMGDTPDTSLVIPGGTGSIYDGGSCSILVFRGVDQITPLDVTPLVNITSNTVKPNPLSITPITSGAVIAVGGVGGQSYGNLTFTSSDLNNFISSCGVDTNGLATSGIGYVNWSGGAFDAAQFGCTYDNTAYSSIAYTIALRPA